MRLKQEGLMAVGVLESQNTGSFAKDDEIARPTPGISALRHLIASESQSRHRKELFYARMVKHSEVLQNFDHKQLLQDTVIELNTIREILAQFAIETSQNNNAMAEKQRKLIDRIRVIQHLLQQRSELGGRLGPIHEQCLPVIEDCLQLNASQGNCSGLELVGFELLEVLTFQSDQQSVLNRAIFICMTYFQNGCLGKHRDPSIALTCSSYLSNSLANSLIGNSDLDAVPVETLKGYFEHVLSLVCLKKSSRYCIISLRLARNILVRYSPRNPKNHHCGNATLVGCSQYLQQHLRVDYLIEQSLKFTSACPKDHLTILIEILWTVNFSQRYSISIEMLNRPSLFMQLTDYMFGQLELITSDQVALPYLSYLASVLALNDVKQLETFTSGQHMKILNSLTSILQNEGAHRSVKREAMLAISNFLAKGMELQCSEVVAAVLVNQESFNSDSFYFKEILYILFSYLLGCISHGNYQESTYTKAIAYSRHKMVLVTYSAEELQDIAVHFSIVMKLLREENPQENPGLFSASARASAQHGTGFFSQPNVLGPAEPGL